MEARGTTMLTAHRKICEIHAGVQRGSWETDSGGARWPRGREQALHSCINTEEVTEGFPPTVSLNTEE